MMNLEQAISYGRHIGVRYYVLNDADCILGGTKTLQQAEDMKKEFEIKDRRNPWTKGSTRFRIEPA